MATADRWSTTVMSMHGRRFMPEPAYKIRTTEEFRALGESARG
jgi:hypothetical protein